MASDTAAYGKSETVPPPVGGALPGKMATVNGGNATTAPNICIEGGRIEFVKSPVDCGDEKQDYLKVNATERAKRISIEDRNLFLFLKNDERTFSIDNGNQKRSTLSTGCFQLFLPVRRTSSLVTCSG